MVSKHEHPEELLLVHVKPGGLNLHTPCTGQRSLRQLFLNGPQHQNASISAPIVKDAEAALQKLCCCSIDQPEQQAHLPQRPTPHQTLVFTCLHVCRDIWHLLSGSRSSFSVDHSSQVLVSLLQDTDVTYRCETGLPPPQWGSQVSLACVPQCFSAAIVSL